MICAFDVVTGPATGAKFLLRPNQSIQIGRAATADFPVIDDLHLSRNHCLLEGNDQGFRVRDVGSSNGTFVNEARVMVAQLCNGDRVRVGSTTLTVSFRDDSLGLDAGISISSKNRLGEQFFPASPSSDQTELVDYSKIPRRGIQGSLSDDQSTQLLSSRDSLSRSIPARSESEIPVPPAASPPATSADRLVHPSPFPFQGLAVDSNGNALTPMSRIKAPDPAELPLTTPQISSPQISSPQTPSPQPPASASLFPGVEERNANSAPMLGSARSISDAEKTGSQVLKTFLGDSVGSVHAPAFANFPSAPHRPPQAANVSLEQPNQTGTAWWSTLFSTQVYQTESFELLESSASAAKVGEMLSLTDRQHVFVLIINRSQLDAGTQSLLDFAISRGGVSPISESLFAVDSRSKIGIRQFLERCYQRDAAVCLALRQVDGDSLSKLRNVAGILGYPSLLHAIMQAGDDPILRDFVDAIQFAIFESSPAGKWCLCRPIRT